MQTNHERMTHDRLDQRRVIMLFLADQKIKGTPDYTQRFPDCIVSMDWLCIEETSARGYDVVDTLSKSSSQKELKLKHFRDKNIIIDRIREAINKKQNHRSYNELPKKYRRRILLVRVNGLGLDWRCDSKALFNTANFSDLQPGIFNEVYLVMYPIYPTKKEIDEKIFERPLRSDFVRIL